MGKVILAGNGKIYEFEDRQAAAKFMEENNITEVEVVTPNYVPDAPFPIQIFENKPVCLGQGAPMSGQEKRRDRRARERQAKKRK